MPLVRRAKPPTAATLRRYGMTEEDWLLFCELQGWKCPACGEPFGDRKLVIDHAHVRRFRRMNPSDKMKHVRGVLHSFCNRYIRGWLTIERCEMFLRYLRDHEARKSA